MDPNAFPSANAIKKFLRSRGVKDRLVARRSVLRAGTIMRSIADTQGLETWWWFVGCERSEFERVEALLTGDGIGLRQWEICRRKTAHEEAKA